VRHALIDYGFSAETAELLIDDLINPGQPVKPIQAKRYGVMECNRPGLWEVWDRTHRCAVDTDGVYPDEYSAQQEADRMNAETNV